MIWISLKDVKSDRKVGDYLLNEWLANALEKPKALVSEEDIQQISDFIKQNNTWILLDGLDEYNSEKFCNESDLIESWIQFANIVVACRNHVWRNNSWGGYDAYRILEFENYREYIDKYFDGNCDLANRLEKHENSHLRDLVANPLLLAITCFVYKEGKKLPETRFSLYTQYLNKLLWRKEKSKKSDRYLKDLRKILGISCRDMIDGEKHTENFDDEFIYLACENSGFKNKKLEEVETLLELAEKAGWIKLIENDLDSEYQFIHKTFQEYFAASYIDDWDFFLPRNHDNDNPRPVQGKRYRVFDDEWQEAIKFWMSKCQSKKEKYEDTNQFIRKLINFKDGLDIMGFYQNRCLSLTRGYIKKFNKCYLNRALEEEDK